MVSNKVIPEADLPRYESKSGMKILIGFLRNKTYEDFLKFVECIFLTQRDDPSKSKALPVVESMIRAVQDFDQREGTNCAEKITAIKKKYMFSTGGEVDEGQRTSEMPQTEAAAMQELASNLSSLAVKESISGLSGKFLAISESNNSKLYVLLSFVQVFLQIFIMLKNLLLDLLTRLVDA